MYLLGHVYAHILISGTTALWHIALPSLLLAAATHRFTFVPMSACCCPQSSHAALWHMYSYNITAESYVVIILASLRHAHRHAALG